MSDTATAEAPKSRKRRPIWVHIPAQMDEEHHVPISYFVHRCETKEEARKVLRKHEIDATNSKHVLMFRAAPIEFKYSQQIILRF